MRSSPGWIPVVAVASLAAMVAAPTEARACSLVGLTPWVLDPSHADDVSPPTLTVTGWSVWRGEGTCAGTGGIQLDLEATDDRSVTLGLELAAIAGAYPASFDPPSGAFSQGFTTGVALFFIDSGQPIDVTLAVRAVDRNGNRSEPAIVRVTDGGAEDSDGGCAAGGGGRGGAALLGLAALGAR